MRSFDNETPFILYQINWTNFFSFQAALKQQYQELFKQILMQNDNNQTEIQAKQCYLRTNIIDKGFDPEQFVSFCGQKYGEIDLETWTLQKLSNVVNQYINIVTSRSTSKFEEEEWNQYEGQQNIPQTNPNPYINTPITISHTPKIQPNNNIMFTDADWDFFLGSTTKTQNNNNNVIKTNTINTTITYNASSSPIDLTQPIHFEIIKKSPELNFPINLPTNQMPQEASSKLKQSKPKAQKDQKPQEVKGKFIRLKTTKSKDCTAVPLISDISINQTEQIARSFLQSDYTVYHILFRPCNHLIKRKFNDFRRLRSILQKLYPHINLPYIQPQGWLVSTSEGRDPQLLGKYKWMIIQFLKFVLIHNQELKNSQLVRDFTGFSKREIKDKQKDVLKKILDDYNLIPKPKFIGELLLSQNNLLIPQDSSYPKYISGHLSIIPQIDLLYDKLRKQLQTLFYNYDVLNKSLGDVINTFQNLQNTITKFNHENNQPKQMRMYEGIRQMCIKLQQNLTEQSLMFKNRISSLFRYQKDNMWTIKQVLEHTSKIVGEYNRQGCPQSALSKSTTMIVDAEPSIPLDQPASKNKNMLAVQYLFWEHTGHTQIRRYWNGLKNKINEQLTLIAYENLDMENQNLNFWNTMIKKCIL